MPRFHRVAHLPPTSSRQRIGLFGGSFDPPHSGHMHVAKTALKRLDLDQVWWFPARGNPLKATPGGFDARLAAVQIMLEGHRAMRASDVEAHAGLTYTIDLIRLMRAHCPNAQLVWIMGSDSLENFHEWKDWQSLAKLVPIAVIARPGSTQASRSSHFAKVFRKARLPRRAAKLLPGHTAPAWTYLNAPLNPASSTALRNKR